MKAVSRWITQPLRLLLSSFLLTSLLSSSSSSSPSLLPSVSAHPKCRLPKPKKRFQSFVAMDFTGLPEDITKRELKRLTKRFKTMYNKLAAKNCDELQRKVKKVKLEVFDTGIGADATETMPATIRVLARVKYVCRGRDCRNHGFLFGMDDFMMMDGDDRRQLQSGGEGVDVQVLDTMQLQDYEGWDEDDDEDEYDEHDDDDEEEEEEEQDYDDDDDDDDDDKDEIDSEVGDHLSDSESDVTEQRFLGSNKKKKELEYPCGCTERRPSRDAPTTRQFVERFRKLLVKDQKRWLVESFFTLTTVLEIVEEDCFGMSTTPSTERQFFNQTIEIQVDGEPTLTTESERNLVGNVLTGTYNLFGEVNCGAEFYRIDKSSIFDDFIIPKNCRGSKNMKKSRCAKYYDQRRRRDVIFNFNGAVVGTCTSCPGKCVDVCGCVDAVSWYN